MSPNQRKARRRKRLKQQKEGILRRDKKNLRKKIIYLIRMKKVREAGILMERYKSKYGDIPNVI